MNKFVISTIVALVMGVGFFLVKSKGEPSPEKTPDVVETTNHDTLVIAAKIDEAITLDPAVSFEAIPEEVARNTYQMLFHANPQNPDEILGDAAEKWEMDSKGLTLTVHLKSGLKFASGNSLTAHDVVYSLIRAIKLNKAPASILTQFGFTPDTVENTIKAMDDLTLTITIAEPVAQTLLMNCLTAVVGAIMDQKDVMSHEKDGDMGTDYLRNHSAGSGPFMVKSWTPNSSIILVSNPNYVGGEPKIKKLVMRHVPEEATQQLLLQKGDVDIALNLSEGKIKEVPNVNVFKLMGGDLKVLHMNQKNKYLKKPEVREAIRYLIDYNGIADKVGGGKLVVHQAFVPKGFPGALVDNPYNLNVKKAKALLKKAGLSKGFTLTLSVVDATLAQAIQANLQQAGIKVEILQGDSKQVLTKIRERKHDLAIASWGPDYFDPHTNAQTFAVNEDNSDQGTNKTLAWRNAWNILALTKKTKAAGREQNAVKRLKLYREIQKEVREKGPFAVMFQVNRLVASQPNISGLNTEQQINTLYYKDVVKG